MRRLVCALTMCLVQVAVSAPGELDPGLRPEALGKPATRDEIASRSNVVFPDGRGLPAGQGTVTQGAALYRERCISCHGVDGRGGIGGELAGGNPDLTAAQPDRTIGTYWPYATTLFDFIRRAMPLNAPWSLSDAETYALVAYLLSVNGVVASDFVADAATVAAVRMPNRDGFMPIDRVNVLPPPPRSVAHP